MLAKRFVLVIALLTLVVSPVVFAPSAVAQSNTPAAVELCRQFDEAGVLEALGVTRGECVTFSKGPSSPQANSVIAGSCGFTAVQVITGTTNKGQCIKALT